MKKKLGGIAHLSMVLPAGCDNNTTESFEMPFEGKTHFYAMAAGYNSQDIFLLNPEPISLLEEGFYKSNDEGELWEPVQAAGLEGEVSALALHPTNSIFVAAATSTGVYFSHDAGKSFEAITKENETGTAVHFTNDHLYFGSSGTTAALGKYTMENKERELLNISERAENAIAFTLKIRMMKWNWPSILCRSNRIVRKTVPGSGKRCCKMAKPIHEQFETDQIRRFWELVSVSLTA